MTSPLLLHVAAGMKACSIGVPDVCELGDGCLCIAAARRALERMKKPGPEMLAAAHAGLAITAEQRKNVEAEALRTWRAILERALL